MTNSFPAVLCLLALPLGPGIAQPLPPDSKLVPLVDQIFRAADDSERARILAANPDLANPELVKALNEAAGQVFDSRDFTKALAFYRASCFVAKELQDREGLGNCTYDIGLTLARLQRNDEALEALNRSVTLLEPLHHKGDLARPLTSICVQFKNQGEFRQALPYCERALADAHDSGNETLIALTNTNLANVYTSLGNYRAAIECLHIALETTRKLGLERQQAIVLNNLGNACFDQHDDQLALSYIEQGLAIREKLKDPQLASSVMNLGVVYQSMDNYAEAAHAFDRALKLTAGDASFAQFRALTTYNYGDLEYRQKHTDAARRYMLETIHMAESIGDGSIANRARIILGQIAEEDGRQGEAENFARTVIAFARESGETEMLIGALDLCGVALKNQAKLREAEIQIREAIELTERLREQLPGDRLSTVHFMDAQKSSYLHMILLQLELRSPESALAYVERLKARALLDVLNQGNDGVTKAMDTEDLNREFGFRQSLTRLNTQILAESHRPTPDRNRIAELTSQREKARTDYRAFELQLYAAHPQLQVQRVEIEPVRPADLIESLPDAKAALLEYAVCEDRVYLFVLTHAPDGSRTPDLRVYRLATPSGALLGDARSFRDKLAARDLGYGELAHSLYVRLLAPAAAQLRGKTTLVISPDNALWQIPFQALEPEPGHYLVEDRSIVLTPSLSVLHAMQKSYPRRLAQQPYVLAMQAAQLPSAQREAAGVRGVYGADHTRVYAGADADEEHLRRDAGKFQILHLAAHGFFENRNPLNSYLLLAKDGKPEAGMWDARGMMELDLHANLVVLSGCETGRGSTGNAEGMIGMAWALFVAGSPSLVASQWKVDSDATTQLMLAFHANLRNSTKSEALRQAALAVMRNPVYRHPFYWSSFVLMGLGF